MVNRWRTALDRIVSDIEHSRDGQEYDLNRIMRSVDAPNQEVLAAELTKKVQLGILKAVYRVLSPETRSGIAEYDDFLEIPEELFDNTTDNMVKVQPGRDLEIIYRANRS